MNLGRFNKLWIALLGAVVTVLVGYFENVEWLQNLVPFLTALGVYQTRNVVGSVSRKR